MALYGYRSTLASLAFALGKSFTSAASANDFRDFMAAHAAATPVVDGAWQRAVEASRANEAFYGSSDAAGVCAFLTAAPLGVRASDAAPPHVLARAAVAQAAAAADTLARKLASREGGGGGVFAW